MAKIKERRISFIVSFCIIALCAYFAISLVSINREISDTKGKIADVNAQSAQQTAENDRLKNYLDKGNMDEYVEEVARDELGYVKPGERVYYDVSVND